MWRQLMLRRKPCWRAAAFLPFPPPFFPLAHAQQDITSLSHPDRRHGRPYFPIGGRFANASPTRPSRGLQGGGGSCGVPACGRPRWRPPAPSPMSSAHRLRQNPPIGLRFNRTSPSWPMAAPASQTCGPRNPTACAPSPPYPEASSSGPPGRRHQGRCLNLHGSASRSTSPASGTLVCAADPSPPTASAKWRPQGRVSPRPAGRRQS